jgi:GTP-binding protein
MIFIDRAKIHVLSGKGGDGALSFRREKHVEMGGPDGGSGGKGGDVWIEADPQKNTLYDFTYRPLFKAGPGENGRAKRQTGACGDDLVIGVPPGTLLFRNGKRVADLINPGDRYLAARGGRGGRGNATFKTAVNTAPHLSEKGEPPEEAFYDLELKLVADVGLLGFPNAGKSTFLSAVTQARPKIADYPFTTLTPNLGVARVRGKTFVIADIPGLIEGAHTGKGLGDEFLRHVERTRILIHLVDVFGYDGKSPAENLRTLNKELAAHSARLAQTPQIVVATKMDLTGSDKALAAFRKSFRKNKIFPLSSATGSGVRELMDAVVKALDKAPAVASFAPDPVDIVIEPDFQVEQTNDGWRVTGKKANRLAAITNFDQDEAVSRFQNILVKWGVEDSLIKAGAQAGDPVTVGDHRLIFRPALKHRSKR